MSVRLQLTNDGDAPEVLLLGHTEWVIILPGAVMDIPLVEGQPEVKIGLGNARIVGGSTNG